MPLAVVQVAHTYPTSGSPTTAATFAAPTTPGNLAVALVGGYLGHPPAATSVTDNRANTYTLDFATAAGPDGIWIAFYSAPITTGGAAHVVTFSEAGVDIANLDIVEISGQLATGYFDRSAQNQATATTFNTGSTGTLSQADEIALVYVAVATGAVATMAQDPSYTLIGEQEAGTAYVSNAAYKVVSSITALDHTWTQTYGSVPYLAAAATYRAAVPTGASGVAQITEGPDTAAIVGTVSAAGSYTGTIVATEVADTTSIAGLVTVPTAVTGVVAATEVTDTSSIVGNVVNPVVARYAKGIAGRKIVDQLGDVYLMRTFSSWAMAENLSNAEITEALEGVAERHFNAVTVIYGGGMDFGGWHAYTNKAGQPFWTGTPWRSTFGAGWSSVDWCVQETQRLGMTINLSMFMSWGTNGNADEFNAATPTQAYNVGVELATRYLAYDHIVWHAMFDYNPGLNTNIDALFHGINDAEGPTRRRVRWCEANQDSTTYGAIMQAGYQHFNISLNGFYEYEANATDRIETSYNEPGATTIPTGDVEPPYDGASHYTQFGLNLGLNLRYRSWAIFLEGGVYENYGHEDWWCFGFANPFGFTEGMTWQQVPDDPHTIQQGYCWTFLDEYVAHPAWAPISTFVTTGQGSGNDRAAIGSSA